MSDEQQREVVVEERDSSPSPTPESPQLADNVQSVPDSSLPEDGYDVTELMRAPEPSELPADVAQLHHIFGIECTKRNNLHQIDDRTLMLSSGNFLQLLNLEDKSIRYIPGLGIGGIGAIAIHPERKFFAVAEKGSFPRILIYSYPDLRLYRILRKGTERAYSALCFNHDGTTLASVGGYPDFMLTVWSWRLESVILRAKAFSQDVFKVKFSPLLDGQLITSGTGHIRFWQMARTFTGLKLQGLIGKFGQVELSDIAAFVELPSGMVLSGTETGNMLLWDGNIIKCEISRRGGVPCHKGAIEVLEFNIGTGQLISGGDDGYIRMWDYTTIEGAEPSDDSPVFELEPLQEVKIGENVKVRELIQDGTQWTLLDANGAIVRMDSKEMAPSPFLECHAGPINAVAASPGPHIAASTGADGTVRILDYDRRSTLLTSQFRCGGTSLMWLPLELDSTSRTLLVGFEDGVVRVLVRCTDGLRLIKATKPHASRVTCLSVFPRDRILATGGLDGVVFFLDISEDYAPIGFINFGSPISSLSWSTAGKLLVCGESGRVASFESPKGLSADTSTSFLLELPAKEFTLASECLIGGSKPMRAVYVSDDRFLLSVGAEKRGDVYECTLDSASPVKTYCSSLPSPCTVLRLSQGNRYLLCGTASGEVRLLYMDSTDKYWRMFAHDGNYGAIHDATTSMDDSYVLTSGNDGVCFVFSISAEMPPRNRSDYGKYVVEMASSSFPIVDDIISDSHYSLEQEKLKAEKDRQLALAESKRKDVRVEIAEMRKEFEQLLQNNSHAHEDEQLSRAEFNIDPDFTEILEQQAAERVEIARKELQWTSAKMQLQLDRLKSVMLDPVAVERIVLLPFLSGHQVSAFRTAHLHPELKRSIEQVHAFLKSEETRAETPRPLSGRRSQSPEQTESVDERESNSQQDVAETDSRLHSSKAQSKVEMRRAQRAERQRLWDELNSRKPPDDYELPEDVHAISWAERNMGDYKLKSGERYVVPEHLRINAEKKRREIVLLEESVFAIKMDFNERLLALRDLKVRIIENIRKHNDRISQINSELQMDDPLFEPDLMPIEAPDHRDRIERSTLLKYEKQMRQEQRRAAQKQKQEQSGGFGGFGGGSNTQKDEMVSDDEEEQGTPLNDARQQRLQAAARATAERAARLAAVRPSSLEEDERAAKRERLLYERDVLMQKIQQTARAFDDALDDLRQEKFKLEGDLKTTDLKLLLLYQELMLLKEVEKKDVELSKQLDKRIAEKTDIIMKMAEITEKITKAKLDVADVVEAERRVASEFETLVPSNHPNRPQFLNIFKKKGHSKKVRERTEDAGDDEDSMSDISDEDMDDSDDEIGENEPDQAPPGQEALYRKVCELRERRWDVEDRFKALSNTVDMLKKEHASRLKDEARIEKALADIESEIQAHQTLKQKRLNELDVVLALHLHQLQCVEQGSLPQNLSSILVFTTPGLQRLRSRLVELDQEREDLAERRKQLAKDSWELQHKLGGWDDIISQLQAKVVEIQMLKFGREIELEKLDEMTENKAADELKQTLGLGEREHGRGLEMLEWQITDARDQLAQATSENTDRLRRLGDLTEMNYKLESSLNAGQGKLVADIGVGATKREQEDRERLSQLVRLQAREIEAIRAEISVLSHKGGHVYTPADRP